MDVIVEIQFNPNINVLKTHLKTDTEDIGFCKFCVSDDKSTWSIASWHVHDKYQQQGYGIKLLNASMEYLQKHFGLPVIIEYIWDADNQYVYDWLVRHFNPKRKTDNVENNWAYNTFILDRNMMLEYIGLEI